MIMIMQFGIHTYTPCLPLLLLLGISLVENNQPTIRPSNSITQSIARRPLQKKQGYTICTLRIFPQVLFPSSTHALLSFVCSSTLLQQGNGSECCADAPSSSSSNSGDFWRSSSRSNSRRSRSSRSRSRRSSRGE